MKVIIAGSRTYTNEHGDEVVFNDLQKLAFAVYESEFFITEVVSGTARGVDTLGEKIAEGIKVPVKRMPADWNTYGKRAGYLRNTQMAEYADAAVILWNGTSNGTKHMISEMERFNKPYHLVII